MKPTRLLLVVAWSAISLARVVQSAASPSPRERLSADMGWKFHLGNEWPLTQNPFGGGRGIGPAVTTFSDRSWRSVDLPHDWAVELPFDSKADGNHGFKALGEGFPQNSVGWYRRTFELPKTDTGRRLWLEFDGVFRDCQVFVNGWFVGRQESGYSSFRFDITDVANCGGTNVIAVRVDATQPEGWFYEGAGIYRHVWLVKTSALAVAPDGVFVFSQFKDNTPTGPASIHLQTQLANAGKTAVDAIVKWEIVAPGGRIVGSGQQAAQVGGLATFDVAQSIELTAPELWSPETPTLYKLITTVVSSGDTVDQTETKFGIRTEAFDATKGFLLNGKPYVIKGASNHLDFAGVGVALPDRLQEFRIARLKEMGVNAYRTAHAPPIPAFLEACDRLGMLVIDENRLLESDPLRMAYLEGMIRRDRNHPSVFLWAIGNEEGSVDGTPVGGRIATTMRDVIRRLDPTRPVTYAAAKGNVYAGINEVVDVRGWNYAIGVDTMDAYHAAHPQQPNVGTEQASTVTTRGIYIEDRVHGHLTAYDNHPLSGLHTAEQWWSFFDSRPWLSGGFVWSGFDYRGEPEPFGWPCISSQFGVMDTCGFPKDNFWYYQSWWTSPPVLHLLPHWNWAGREGQEIDVRALSNCEEVELFLNGRSLGRQAMKRASHLEWKVPYAPGTLAAKGYAGGKLVAEAKVETTSAPAAVQLNPDRSTINADGADISLITVSVADDQNRIVPVAGNSVTFTLEGPGRIIGVGNGDPSSHEADVVVANPLVHTTALDGWRWKMITGSATRGEVKEIAAQFDDSAWEKTDVNAESGPLGAGERGVFRTKFTVSDQELKAPVTELWFGKIEGRGMVYLNGRRVGPSGDLRAPSVYDVTTLLHPGENTIAVSVAYWGAMAGLTKGVTLRRVENPPAAQWGRSVFNGLAQVIVQSSRKSGAIKLTAQSPGLKPAVLSLRADPVTPLPSLP